MCLPINQTHFCDSFNNPFYFIFSVALRYCCGCCWCWWWCCCCCMMRFLYCHWQGPQLMRLFQLKALYPIYINYKSINFNQLWPCDSRAGINLINRSVIYLWNCLDFFFIDFVLLPSSADRFRTVQSSSNFLKLKVYTCHNPGERAFFRPTQYSYKWLKLKQQTQPLVKMSTRENVQKKIFFQWKMNAKMNSKWSIILSMQKKMQIHILMVMTMESYSIWEEKKIGHPKKDKNERVRSLQKITSKITNLLVLAIFICSKWKSIFPISRPKI